MYLLGGHSSQASVHHFWPETLSKSLICKVGQSTSWAVAMRRTCDKGSQGPMDTRICLGKKQQKAEAWGNQIRQGAKP